MLQLEMLSRLRVRGTFQASLTFRSCRSAGGEAGGGEQQVRGPRGDPLQRHLGDRVRRPLGPAGRTGGVPAAGLRNGTGGPEEQSVW